MVKIYLDTPLYLQLITNIASISCGKCSNQILQKRSLLKHKKIVHEGVKYYYRQCDHKAISKGNLTLHIRAVHEGVKYPWRQCDNQATS